MAWAAGMEERPGVKPAAIVVKTTAWPLGTGSTTAAVISLGAKPAPHLLTYAVAVTTELQAGTAVTVT
jgi:hypothetical protein